MGTSTIRRRELIAGLALAGTAIAAGYASAVPAQSASPAAELSAVVTATAECQRAGRVCLAHCTDFLADGMSAMADCQRAVMNMLAVTGAMSDVAGFGNATATNIAALAATCARQGLPDPRDLTARTRHRRVPTDRSTRRFGMPR